MYEVHVNLIKTALVVKGASVHVNLIKTAVVVKGASVHVYLHCES